MSVDVGQGHRGLDGPDVDADDDEIVIEAQERRAPAARRPSGGPFQHPMLADQFFDDQRNGAALQSRDARQIGARERLALADQVENNAAIDLARHLAGGDLYPLRFRWRHVLPLQTIYPRPSAGARFLPTL